MDPIIDGQPAVEWIKSAYGLLPGQTPTFDMNDETQKAARRIKDWITMAEHDALNERKSEV